MFAVELKVQGTHRLLQAANRKIDVFDTATAGHRDKFVAGKTGNQVVLPKLLLATLSHRRQNHVASKMPEGVVDLLEMVDVDDQQAECQAEPRRSLPLFLEPPLEVSTVRQTGERVSGRSCQRWFKSIPTEQDILVRH